MGRPARQAIGTGTTGSPVIADSVRLAIKGITDSETQQLSVRLRQTSIVASFDACGTIAPMDCDAVAFLGHALVSEGLISECLSKGMHVLLAAPARLCGDEFARLSATAAAANVQFSVVNPDRYLPSRRLIHDQLRTGQLGEAGFIRSQRWESRDAFTEDERHLPEPLVCDLDLTSWLFGAWPEVICAFESGAAGPATPGTQSQVGNAANQRARTSVQVHLGFPGGGMALVDYSNQLPQGSGYQMLSVIGSAGVACADDHRNTQLHFSGGLPRGLPSSERTRGMSNLVQAFVDDLMACRDMSTDVQEWQKVRLLAEAVKQSLESRTSVDLKESGP